MGELEGTPGGAVSRWSLGEDGKAELVEWASVGSGYPAHLLAVPGQGMLYTANYGGSSFSGLQLGPGGELGELELLETFPQEGESCRDASHPHQTVARGPWVWLVDLGCDRIRHYRHTQEEGLQLVGTTEVRAGCGPRHLTLHPSLPLAFLLCELQSVVQVYGLDEQTGGLSLQQEVELSSTEGDAGAEILVQGDFVYATSRGSGVLVVYRLQETGLLTRLQELVLAGSWPRSLALRGGLGAVVDQFGDTLQLLLVDESTGLVTGAGTVATPPGPAFVHFIASDNPNVSTIILEHWDTFWTLLGSIWL